MDEVISQDEIPIGFDFLQTAPEGAVFRFDKIPIPAGFFADKSHPFTNIVKFRGRSLPSSYFNGQDITHVDTIVQRKESVALTPPYPSSHLIPIELVALALESIEPIEVRVGNRTEHWDVQVELSKSQPSSGTMTITKTDAKGGFFDSEFLVLPVFRFIRQCDGKERVLDVGTLPLSPEIVEMITLRSRRTPWLHSAPGTLRLRGLNDNFVAGAPYDFNEESEACFHPSSEAPDCEVVILAQSRCLCLGKTRPFTGKGSPEGGTYTWSIVQGANRASIVGGANQKNVTVRGTSTSGAADDIRLKVEYQCPDGGTDIASIGLTTIDAQLTLRDSGTISFENQAQQDPSTGFPQLGATTPGNPPGCTGFFKNVEIRTAISPGDLSIACKDEFRFRRKVIRGRSGLLFPDGTFDDDDIDCPVGPCPDPPPLERQDLTLAPSTGTASLIFDIDAPGFRTTADLGCQGEDGRQGINWAHFEEWLEVKGQRCGNTILWHAITRVECQSGNWVVLNSSVGLGHPPPGFSIPQQLLDFGLPEATQLMTADTAEDRIKARNRIRQILSASQASDSEQQQLVQDLIKIAEDNVDNDEFASPLVLAIQLLGILQVEEAIPIFTNNLLKSSNGPVSVGIATPASQALVNLGAPAIPAIIERASSANNKEWIILEYALKSLADQSRVRKEICSALDSDPNSVAEARLDQYLHS